jgi:hypothetical protein
LCCFGWLWW